MFGIIWDISVWDNLGYQCLEYFGISVFGIIWNASVWDNLGYQFLGCFGISVFEILRVDCIVYNYIAREALKKFQLEALGNFVTFIEQIEYAIAL